MKFFRHILKFFDKLEDHIRDFLSHYPVPYSLIGGVAIVLFWKGVWDVADKIPFFNGDYGPIITISFSVILLLSTGLFVSFFIGDTIILSGLKREKKLAEKTEEDIKQEVDIVNHLRVKLNNIEKLLEEIREKLE